MKKIISILFILSLIIFTSCNKKVKPIDCDNFENALLMQNNEIIEEEFIKITVDLKPKATENDKIGHKDNYTKLISRINECEKIEAELTCYACLESLPTQSILTLTIDSIGINVKRTIYVWTPEDDILSAHMCL